MRIYAPQLKLIRVFLLAVLLLGSFYVTVLAQGTPGFGTGGSGESGKPDNGITGEDSDPNPSISANKPPNALEALLTERLKRYSTYRCEYTPIQIDQTLTPNVTPYSKVDTVELQPCKVETKKTGSLDGLRSSDDSEVVVTMRAKVPMWVWLNSTNPFGTTDSPILSPCVLAVNENKISDQTLNFANKYACRAEVANDPNKYLPLIWNGLGCTYATSVFRERRVGVTTQPYPLSSFTAGPRITESTDIERKQLGSISAESALLAPYEAESTLKDPAKIFTNQVREYPNFDSQVSCSDGSGAIDSYYTGDTHITPSFKKDVSYINANTAEVDIPLLYDALASAYRLQTFDLSATAFIPSRGKFIHRNNIGIKAEVTKAVYRKNDSLINQIFTREIKLGRNEDPKVVEEPTEYFSLIPPAYTETQTLHLPWVGQLRDIYKRITYFTNDITNTYFKPTDNYNVTLGRISELLKSGSNLNSNYFAGTTKSSVDLTNAKTLFASAQAMLRAELNIMNCRDIDSFKRQVQALPQTAGNSASHISQLAAEVDRTDCYDDQNNYIDPLQGYLCSKNLLSSAECIGAGPTEQACVPLVSETTGDIPSSFKSNSGNSSSGSNLTNNSYSQPIKSGHLARGLSTKHPGVDWGVGEGSEVLSIADNCTVLFAGVADTDPTASQYVIWSKKDTNGLTSQGYGGFGIAVMLECKLADGKTIYPTYAHLAPQSIGKVKVGQTVNKGDVIGYSGNTGNSSAPHLHFELRKNKLRSQYVATGGSIYYYRCANTQEGRRNDCTDPNYYDGLCLFYGNCDFSFSVGPGDNSGQCFPDLPPGGGISDNIPPNQPGRYSMEDRNTLITDQCPSASTLRSDRYFTPADLAVINASVSRADTAGSLTIDKLTGGKYKGNIFGIIKAVSDITGVPFDKLASQLHNESFGPFQPQADLTNNRKYNGNVDQIRNSSPNMCGCVGPGQFCPGTGREYFHPNGKFYGSTNNGVLQCVRALGLNVAEGSLIYPSYAGSSICAMAVKLKADTGGDSGIANWDAGCCSASGEFTPGSCRHYKATERYLGSCTGRPEFVEYCKQTANICDPTTVISRYKRDQSKLLQ